MGQAKPYIFTRFFPGLLGIISTDGVVFTFHPGLEKIRKI